MYPIHPFRQARDNGSRRFFSLTVPFVILSVLLAAGCGEDTTGPETRNEIVVFGFLYVNETLSDSNAVFIARTMPVESYYDVNNAVIANATVTILKDGDTVPDTLTMVEPGYYNKPDLLIEELTTYDLTVQVGGETVITATTTTPDAFQVIRAPVDFSVMRYEAIPDSFPITFQCENDDQIFMVDCYCLEEWQDARIINPITDADTVADYDEYGGDNGEPRHINPYFRIDGLERDGEDYLIEWYSACMVFYGEYDLQVFSIDENYYNYIYKDHPELNGGIHGGIGVFGSACREKWHVEVIE